MKVEAKLIQASNNLATNDVIYTFLLTYHKKHWLLDMLGLSRFSPQTNLYVTGTQMSQLLADVYTESTYHMLRNQIVEVMSFSKKVFTAVNNGGRFSGADIKKGMDLFGDRLQKVLKQYKVGECHLPTGTGINHLFRATLDGWKQIR